jgi:asparagine synthase (glutamine-hydrolysing)
MCGFVGYLIPNPQARPDLKAWSEIIAHRGPDSFGAFSDEAFGVGFRRLAIVDLSEQGSQPMQGLRYALAFNGEIYNHAQLRRELPGPWRGHSDSETLLRAIETWGIGPALERLNGMYALALWDRQERALTLARDPLGVKPLFYLKKGENLFFASEIKALLPHANKHLSREALALYTMLGFVPAPFCLVEGIGKLSPGEIRSYGTRLHQSFSTYHRWKAQATVHPADLRQAVKQASVGQLMSDVPVGVFLSGGVDSSVVAALAAHSSGGLASFSLRPSATANPQAGFDADMAQRQAQQYGFKHLELSIAPQDYSTDPDGLLNHLDEPVHEPYFLGEERLARAAQEAGVKVVLTGHGGDEVFMGYGSYQAVRKGERYDQIPWLGPTLKTASQFAFFKREQRENFAGAAKVWRQDFVHSYAVRSSVLYSAEQAAQISGLPLEQINALMNQVLQSTLRAVHRLPTPGRPLRPAELAARMDLLLNVAEHYNMRLDRASMAASVEARVPLQDLELLDCVMRIPGNELMKGGLKGLLKHSFSDVLPKAILNKPKHNFQAPIRDWLRGPLAGWAQARMAGLGQHLGIALNWTPPQTTQEAYQLWSLALLEAWRRRWGLEVRG